MTFLNQEQPGYRQPLQKGSGMCTKTYTGRKLWGSQMAMIEPASNLIAAAEKEGSVRGIRFGRIISNIDRNGIVFEVDKEGLRITVQGMGRRQDINLITSIPRQTINRLGLNRGRLH